MKWEIVYHKEVESDLKSIGHSSAKRIITTINKKLTCDPERFGAPLSHHLKNFRKLRIGDFDENFRGFIAGASWCTKTSDPTKRVCLHAIAIDHGL